MEHPKNSSSIEKQSELPSLAESSQKKCFFSFLKKLCPFHKKESIESKSIPAEEPLQNDFIKARSEHFKALTAEDICIPRTDIVAVPIDVTYKDLVTTFLECSFSRIPVYQNTLDQIVGMVHIKDVLRSSLDVKKFSLHSLLKDVLFISPAIFLRDLLLEMQASHIHLAIVVDEFGGVDGLVTLEGVIEKLVGDINNSHESKTTPKILQTGEGVYLADARLSIEDFYEKTGFMLNLPNRDEDINTLGGYVTALLGHMPSRGEIVTSQNGLEFEVIDSDPRRLNRLRIHLPIIKNGHLESTSHSELSSESPLVK
ncbi:MAG: HlyC/CorC family transporter [Proteobacteria bacterium]|nr:HlyC/CorC family transporter [Pseudomonadota bacterium]